MQRARHYIIQMCCLFAVKLIVALTSMRSELYLDHNIHGNEVVLVVERLITISMEMR